MKNTTVKNAAKSTSTTKKSTKTVEVTTRKSTLFVPSAKMNVKELGDGQRAAIAKALGKTGATRAKLIAVLPAIKPTIISWYLSKMVAAKLVKKAA